MVLVRARSAFSLGVTAALLGLGLSGSAHLPAQATTPAVQSGWVRECAGKAFCFLRPASLVLKPNQVIDSLAAEYHSDTLVLRYDYGRYPSSLSHLVNPREEKISVDGRAARAIYSESEIVLVVPKVHEAGAYSPQLTMHLIFKARTSAELAGQVFNSIAFMPPR